MSWQNQNTSKKVFTFSRPLAEEEQILASVPENATITAIERNTKNIKITYVIENIKLTAEEIINLNNKTVKPIKLKRTGAVKPVKRSEKRIKYTDDVLAVVNIADFHLNRKVYGDETYNNDYDIEKASAVFISIIDNVKQNLRNNSFKVQKILLNTCGDFLNSDTKTGTTTAGTPQINDVSWKQAFSKATSLLEYALSVLSTVAPVEFFYIKGNHDEQVGYYLTSWLSARFKNVKNIYVNECPKPRHVVEYENNVIIFTHGESEGRRAIDLPFIEPESISKLSDATNLEVISGHLHHNSILNKNGVTWEILSSACPVQDEWMFNKAFSNHKKEVTINYYNSHGRVQHDIINVNNLYSNLNF